jgi:uncharacterized protein with HEPN domain/predicted nucleotidyltransferase
MTRDEALAKLKSAEGELRALGVGELYLYGSVARNEADAKSDVDLFMEPAPDRPLGFREYMRAREMLEELLGTDVDFTTRRSLHPLITKRAERDAVRVFGHAGRGPAAAASARHQARGRRHSGTPMPKKPPRSPRLRLIDILEETRFIAEASRGRSAPDVVADPMLRRAVERSLSIISEASRHLPETLTTDHLQIPWREIRRIGSVLRHDYEHIDPDVVTKILAHELGALEHACETILASLPPEDD